MQIRDLIPWGRHEDRARRGALTVGRREDEMLPFMALHREVNRLFDDVFRDIAAPSFGEAAWPSLEMDEDETTVRVSAELPGMDENDVEVVFRDGVLTLRGEKRMETKDKDRHYSERYYGRFERSVAVPAAVDEDGITATFAKGVLTVSLPKSKSQQDGVRRIPIAKH